MWNMRGQEDAEESVVVGRLARAGAADGVAGQMEVVRAMEIHGRRSIEVRADGGCLTTSVHDEKETAATGLPAH